MLCTVNDYMTQHSLGLEELYLDRYIWSASVQVLFPSQFCLGGLGLALEGTCRGRSSSEKQVHQALLEASCCLLCSQCGNTEMDFKTVGPQIGAFCMQVLGCLFWSALSGWVFCFAEFLFLSILTSHFIFAVSSFILLFGKLILVPPTVPQLGSCRNVGKVCKNSC